LWQANYVAAQLRVHHPDLAVELVPMTTRGDQWLQAPLSEVGGKGLFIKELERAMLDGKADIAVHSVKDVPAELPEQFAMPVIAFRDAVEDVLIGAKGGLDALPAGARIGSSSLRRKAQLLQHRPDLEVAAIRGNVNSRLRKLAAGEYDAIVLAAAGLNRLGIVPDDAVVLPVEASLPAPGQGALGIECLAGSEVASLLSPLVDETTAACVEAERGVSLGLGADCSLPVAALARLEPASKAGVRTLHLRALLASENGQQILRAESRGSEAHALAREVVALLYAQGAADVLAALRQD